MCPTQVFYVMAIQHQKPRFASIWKDVGGCCTGNWAEGEVRDAMAPRDSDDEDEVYGDFEDVETGERFARAATVIVFCSNLMFI